MLVFIHFKHKQGMDFTQCNWLAVASHIGEKKRWGVSKGYGVATTTWYYTRKWMML